MTVVEDRFDAQLTCLLTPHPFEPLVLVDHLDAELGGLLELGAGAGAGDDEVGLGRDGARDLRAPSRSAIAFASSRVMRTSEPVKTTVLPATGESPRPPPLAAASPPFKQPVELLLVMRPRGRTARSPPPRPDRSPRCRRSRRAPPRRLSRRRWQSSRSASKVAEVAGEQPRIRLADMADAERVDEAVQIHSRAAPRSPASDCRSIVSL